MKQLSYFLLFLFINFLIFSSYNYILNFISYSNPVSNTAQFLINKFRGGIKGYLTNLIRYVFVMFDFSGIIDIFGFGKLIENLQDKFFALIGETRNSYTSPYFDNFFAFTSKRSLSRSYLGFIGLLTFYPVLIYSILIIFRKKISKKTILLATLTLFYIGNILIFSRVMVFTRFNMRYLLAFLVVEPLTTSRVASSLDNTTSKNAEIASKKSSFVSFFPNKTKYCRLYIFYLHFLYVSFANRTNILYYFLQLMSTVLEIGDSPLFLF